MLRIYALSDAEVVVNVAIGFEPAETVVLRPGRDIFEPAYAEFINFPRFGPVNITVTHASSPAEGEAPGTRPLLWAMASSTSNATQEITIFSEQ
jgi:hypothetical protein